MTDREFALIVSLFRATVPQVTARNLEEITRRFKALCSSWSVQVSAVRMNQLAGLLSSPNKIQLHRANFIGKNHRRNKLVRARYRAATADDGSFLQDSGGPVASDDGSFLQDSGGPVASDDGSFFQDSGGPVASDNGGAFQDSGGPVASDNGGAFQDSGGPVASDGRRRFR